MDPQTPRHIPVAGLGTPSRTLCILGSPLVLDERQRCPPGRIKPGVAGSRVSIEHLCCLLGVPYAAVRGTLNRDVTLWR